MTMKNIINILIISLAGLVLVGCNSYNYEAPVKTLSVVSSDLYFPWDGGEGTITIKSEGAITSASSKDWCHVRTEGNVVIVEVDKNKKYAGRTALVTIKSGNESTSVPVTQRPSAFTLGALNVSVGEKAGTSSFEASASEKTISASTEDDWIKNPKYENGKIVFDYTRNEEADARTGHISVTEGTITHKVAVTQGRSEYATFLGDWNMNYAETDSTVYNRTLTFETKVFNESYKVSGLDLDYDFEIRYIENEKVLSLSGQYLGKYQPEDEEYNLFFYPVNSKGLGYAKMDDEKYIYYGVHVSGSDDEPVYGFVDRGALEVETIEGMALVGETKTGGVTKYTRFFTYMRWTLTRPEKK